MCNSLYLFMKVDKLIPQNNLQNHAFKFAYSKSLIVLTCGSKIRIKLFHFVK